MNNLEKVKAWLSAHGYTEYTDKALKDHYVCAFKTYANNNIVIAGQLIGYNARDNSTYATIKHSDYSDSREKINALFIPLNRVKADEEELKKYIKEECDHVKDEPNS